MYRNNLYYYIIIQQIAILKIHYILIGVFMTPVYIFFSINNVVGAIIFLVLGNSNLGKLLLAQYGHTVLP